MIDLQCDMEVNSNLDEIIDKAERLEELLRECNALVDELSKSSIELEFKVKGEDWDCTIWSNY